MSRAALALAFLLLLSTRTTVAQQAFVDHGKVIYQGPAGSRVDLGPGFNPLLSADGRVVFIRGRKFDYGTAFDCTNRQTKNWVAAYDPVKRSERVLFDRALPFERDGIAYCVFNQMQLSLDGSTLYLVSPVYATSGSLAIVRLATGRVTYVGGVKLVYVIRSGSHAGELIYQRRMSQSERVGYYYPWVHAAADGEPMNVLSDEPFTIGGTPAKDAPRLKAYLQSISGQIVIDGRAFP